MLDHFIYCQIKKTDRRVTKLLFFTQQVSTTIEDERKLCFFKSDLAQPSSTKATLDLMSGNCLPKLSSYMKSWLITLLPIIIGFLRGGGDSPNHS